MRVSQAHLLGSPLGDDDCITAALEGKVEALRRLGDAALSVRPSSVASLNVV